MLKTVIDVKNLKKTYGKVKAVEDVSFQVRAGEIFGLLGPNGAGKTTTVECLQGLRQPDSADIRILGFDPRHQVHELRRHIGSQLQQSALPDRLKVWEALDLFSSVNQRSSNWETLLEQWGLADKRSSSFSSLSGGQRQRLFIALALVNNPEIVFLDEMTTGLDPGARRTAWELIRTIRDKGATIVLVTHFMEEAERLCDRIAIVDRGKVVAIDSPQSLITGSASSVQVVFSVNNGTNLDFLRGIPQVKNIARKGARIEVEGNGPVLALVAASLVEHGIVPSDLKIEQPNLEDIFLKITGRSSGD
ncbi:MAG: ABC transporter ATP-binding protein [Dehalococcoidales bacterium]|nr:ABC transporter ATP-binding protein [Dehalococcoidales bacterium]